MRTLSVALGERSYPVYVGAGLLQKPGMIAAVLPQKRAAIVTNTTVAPLYLDRLASGLKGAGVETVPVILPDGEDHKTWQTLNLIFDALIEHRCERRTTLIALGGGVVGDMTGFAAATWQRGAPFIQVPTTLLAQVDSSIGGKTAINHPLGKNMIGAFYQPRAVFADLETLSSLPDRELRAGLAEVIKHGLIRDADFFSWLESNIEALLARDPDALEHAVVRCCEIKAEIVALDDREADQRAWLNFGHTFGHAIEAGLGFGTWLHGEAIAAGMVMAANMSRRVGGLGEAEVARIENILERASLPQSAPPLSVDRYLELMSLDKKSRDGSLRFVLLEGLGKVIIRDDIPLATVRATLEHCTRVVP